MSVQLTAGNCKLASPVNAKWPRTGQLESSNCSSVWDDTARLFLEQLLCLLLWAIGHHCRTAMHITGSVLGYRRGRSPGKRVVRASALSAYISVTIHEEKRVAKTVMHSCTVHIERSEVEHWKHLPSSHVGQHFPCKGFLMNHSLTLRARAR